MNVVSASLAYELNPLGLACSVVYYAEVLRLNYGLVRYDSMISTVSKPSFLVLDQGALRVRLREYRSHRLLPPIASESPGHHK